MSWTPEMTSPVPYWLVAPLEHLDAKTDAVAGLGHVVRASIGAALLRSNGLDVSLGEENLLSNLHSMYAQQRPDSGMMCATVFRQLVCATHSALLGLSSACLLCCLAGRTAT